MMSCAAQSVQCCAFQEVCEFAGIRYSLHGCWSSLSLRTCLDLCGWREAKSGTRASLTGSLHIIREVLGCFSKMRRNSLRSLARRILLVLHGVVSRRISVSRHDHVERSSGALLRLSPFRPENPQLVSQGQPDEHRVQKPSQCGLCWASRPKSLMPQSGPAADPQ